jgi:hypothetical protein
MLVLTGIMNLARIHAISYEGKEFPVPSSGSERAEMHIAASSRFPERPG